MSRNKKKKSTPAGQRRQEEIRRRIGRAAENAEKKKPKEPANPQPPAQPEKPGTKAPAREAKPVPKPERRRERPSHTRYGPVPQPIRKVLSVHEDGTVSFPTRMGLSDLMKAIRNDDPSGTGNLYIGLDGVCPEPGRHSMSYSYTKGLFNRLEAVTGRKSGQQPVLADLLDARVRELRAEATENGTDWYAGVMAAPESDTEQEED